jgi:hypothetical protein
VYKYGNPEPLAHDYFQYYHLYQRFDVGHVISPHNMRLVGSFFVFLLYKLNVFYNTECFVDRYESWGFLKQVYFDAVFFNFICVSITASLIFKIALREIKNHTLAIIGGMLYLFGFGTIFYCMMPLTEACSIFLFVIFLDFYLKKSKWAFLILAVLIFQREYLLIMIGTFSLIEFYSKRSRYYLTTGIFAIICFLIYYVLRKTIFYNSALDYQSNPDYMWSNLIHINLNLLEYSRQLLLSLNLFAIYVGLVIYKKRQGLSIDSLSFFILVFLFVQVNLVVIAGGHGNNVGRYFYLISPYLILVICREFMEVKQKVLREERRE